MRARRAWRQAAGQAREDIVLSDWPCSLGLVCLAQGGRASWRQEASTASVQPRLLRADRPARLGPAWAWRVLVQHGHCHTRASLGLASLAPGWAQHSEHHRVRRHRRYRLHNDECIVCSCPSWWCARLRSMCRATVAERPGAQTLRAIVNTIMCVRMHTHDCTDEEHGGSGRRAVRPGVASQRRSNSLATRCEPDHPWTQEDKEHPSTRD